MGGVGQSPSKKTGHFEKECSQGSGAESSSAFSFGLWDSAVAHEAVGNPRFHLEPLSECETPLEVTLSSTPFHAGLRENGEWYPR